MTPLLDPPRREDFAVRRAELVAATAQEIGTAGEGLFEEAFLLEHLAEHEHQHLGVTRIPHRLDPRAPPVDERLRISSVLFEDLMRTLVALAGDAADRF